MSSARIYYLFTSLMALGMGTHVTAYSPFLASIGLTLGQIALVNTIFWAVVVLAELPTGMFADGRSRAFSLKMGACFYALGGVVYFTATGFWSAALAEAVIGIGGAFISGAGAAWMADALTREGRPEELRRVYATEHLLKALCMLGGGVAGSAIALLGLRWVWIPLALCSGAAALVAHARMNGRGEPLQYVSEWQAFVLALRALRESRALVWAVAALLVFSAAVVFNLYWAIYFRPEVGQMGLAGMWTLMYGGLALASQAVRRMQVRQGNEASLIALSILLAGVGVALVALMPSVWWALSPLLLHEIGRGMFEPLSASYVQHRVHTSFRATFGSLQSFLGRMGFALVPFVAWIVLQGEPDGRDTIAQVWIGSAVFLIVGAIVLWLCRPKTA